MASGIRMSLPTISQFRATTAMIRRVPKSAPSGAMHKREDGFVVVDEDVCIAAATATWLVRTARHSTMLKKGT